MVNTKIESLIELLKKEDMLDSEKIKDCITVNKINKEDVPLHIKKVILKRIISNEDIAVVKNIQVLADLGLMPSNSESNELFVAASEHVKIWEGVYNSLLENNITPVKNIAHSGANSFFEKLFNAREYKKIKYLYEKGVHAPEEIVGKRLYEFIRELDVESFKLCIDVGLWRNDRNVFQFYHIQKHILEKRIDDLSEMISYLYEKNVLNANAKKQICLSLLLHDIPFTMMSNVFKKLQPDLSYEGLNMGFLSSRESNVYDNLIKNDFEKLNLCELYNLKIKNISAFKLLECSLMNDASSEDVKRIMEKAEKIDPKELLHLAKLAFKKNRKDDAFFFSTKTNHQKAHYHVYRSTVDLSKKNDRKEFLENMEKHFLKFINEPDLLSSRGYYRKASPLVIAFCFETDKFNKYLDKGYVKDYGDVICTAIKQNFLGLGRREDKLNNEEFFEKINFNLSNEEKNKVLSHISQNIKKSEIELEEKSFLLILISKLEKKLLESEMNTILTQDNYIKRRI